MRTESKLQKASYKELADALGVTVSTISKYPKKKRDLMLLGLKVKLNYLKNTKD